MDRTSGIWTSLASFVESFALATLISIHWIHHSQAQLHHLPWTFREFLLRVVAPKNAENLLCFDITLHSNTSREGLSIKQVDLPNLPPIPFIQTSAWGWDLGKLTLLCTSYSLDFGSCFTFNLLKFKPKYCFKKILHNEKFHSLVSFSFETQFEVSQNDPELVFEGDIFAQTAAIPQWRALDQTLI